MIRSFCNVPIPYCNKILNFVLYFFLLLLSRFWGLQQERLPIMSQTWQQVMFCFTYNFISCFLLQKISGNKLTAQNQFNLFLPEIDFPLCKIKPINQWGLYTKGMSTRKIVTQPPAIEVGKWAFCLLFFTEVWVPL